MTVARAAAAQRVQAAPAKLADVVARVGDPAVVVAQTADFPRQGSTVLLVDRE